MSSIERTAPGDWIMLGDKNPVEAVVCSIRPGRVEVVFLDEHNKAVHAEAKWSKQGWVLADKDSRGKPADKDPRLERYVGILRSGVHPAKLF